MKESPCFLCRTTKTPKHTGFGKDGSLQVWRSRLRIFLEYFLDSSFRSEGSLRKQNLLEEVLESLRIVELCNTCGSVAEQVATLHQQLEVIQMRIADAVRGVRTAVRGEKLKTTVELTGGVPPKQDSAEDEEGKQTEEELVVRFHKLVKETDSSVTSIPLVYLRRVNIIPDPPTLPPTNNIKAEPVDMHCDDSLIDDDMTFDVSVGVVKTEPVSKRKYNRRNPSASTIPPKRSKRNASVAASVRLKASTIKLKKPKLSATKVIHREIMQRIKERNRDTVKRHKDQIRSKQDKVKLLRTRRCEYCDFAHQIQWALDAHLKTEHEKPEEVNFKCPDCSLGFTTQQYYEFHVQRHVHTWPCDICGMHVVALDLRRHLEAHDPGGRVFNCAYCDRFYGKLTAFVSHVTTTHGGAKVVCPLCSPAEEGVVEEFQARTKLPQHLFEGHGLEEFQLKCDHPGCSRIFFDIRKLRLHKDKHGDKLQCDQCGTNVNGVIALRLHIKTVHPKKAPHVCPECDIGFKYDTTMRTHMYREHGLKVWQHECELCGEEVDEKSRKFLLRTTYLMHMWKVHGVGEREYPCSQCPKVFSKTSLLNIHLETHSLTKNYKCEICDYETKTRKMMGRHRARHNTDGSHRPTEKKHVCHTCGRAFGKKQTLHDHMRTHTGERPFICDVCGSAFTQKSALNSHRKRHSAL